MTNDLTVNQAEVVIKKHSSSLFIWLLPLIALITGAWLVYKSSQDIGVEFSIYFPVSQGVKANETEVRFEGVKVGLVKTVTIAQDLKGVDALIEIDKIAAGILQEDTVFWLVEPVVSLSRVTGLDTLLSGKYISLQFGDKTGRLPKDEIIGLSANTFSYNALDEAPLTPVYKGGLHVVVNALSTGSVVNGAPVMYRKYTVGIVEKIAMQDDGTVRVYLYIYEQFKHFVKKDTKFWNASGLSLKGSLSNISIDMDSVTSLLIGGISFDTLVKKSATAVNSAEYTLYGNRELALLKSTEITISFRTGDGLQVGTLLKYNGIRIGEVTEVEFSSDLNNVQLTLALSDVGKSFAKQGSEFWVVKLKLGLANTGNLDTLVTGNFITVSPGDGAELDSFTGLNNPPSIMTREVGLKIVLQTEQLGSIKQGVKIYYRNVPVGVVDGYELANNAQTVQIHTTIEPRFSPLIRKNTKFWNISGIGVDFSLFKGAKIRTGSVESMLAGGIAFATPANNKMGALVGSGQVFTLYNEAKDSWQAWSPKINIAKPVVVTPES